MLLEVGQGLFDRNRNPEPGAGSKNGLTIFWSHINTHSRQFHNQINEASKLKLTDIDSKRMQIRIEQLKSAILFEHHLDDCRHTAGIIQGNT